MHHPVLFVIGLFLLARMFVRARMRRRWALAGGGGGCGMRRCGGGAIDLGAPDGELGRRGARWAPWGRHRRWQREMRATQKQGVDVVGALELNQRQREIYDDTVGKAKAKLAV